MVNKYNTWRNPRSLTRARPRSRIAKDEEDFSLENFRLGYFAWKSKEGRNEGRKEGKKNGRTEGRAEAGNIFRLAQARNIICFEVA